MTKKTLFPIRRLLIFILVGFAIVLLIAWLINYLNEPNVSTQSTVSQTEAAESEPIPPRNLTTKHFSLTYRADLDTVSDISGNDQTALEIHRLVGSTSKGRRLLVITVKLWPMDGLEGESSYISRSRNKVLYSEETLRLGDQDFKKLTNIETGEITAFTRGSNRLAMIAYSVSVPGADVESEFSELLGAFDWQ